MQSPTENLAVEEIKSEFKRGRTGPTSSDFETPRKVARTEDDQNGNGCDLPESGYDSSPEMSVDKDEMSSADCSQSCDFPNSIRVDEDSQDMSFEELINNASGANDRPYAERELSYTVEISPRTAKAKKKEQEESVLEGCCALLTSGGGLLIMRISNYQSLKNVPTLVDRFWEPIEPQLRAIVEPSKYDDVFERHVDSDSILLFINAPQHFCSRECDLRFPGDHRAAHQATYEQVVELLQKQTRVRESLIAESLKKLPEIPLKLTLRQKLTFHESKRVQFKSVKSATVLDATDSNKNLCDHVRKLISAFANSSGGVILIGITDEGEVEGFHIEKNSEEVMEERLKFLLEKMCCGFPRWERKVHWDMEYIPVSDSKAVLVVKVASMESLGGVFVSCPKSFVLERDSGNKESVRMLDFNEWRKRMLSGEDLRTHSKATEQLCQRFENVLKTSKGTLLTIKGERQKIRDAFFTAQEGFPVTPGGFEANLPDNAQIAIKKMQEKFSSGNKKGLFVASRCWHANRSAAAGVICDLLLISPNINGLYLFTLCHGNDADAFLPYSREAATQIKRRLVEDGGCREKFYVSYDVVPCDDMGEPCLRCNWYPHGYNMDREKTNRVLMALVLILAAVPSPVGNKIGVTFLNLLTVEQFKLVYQQIEINRELWVRGAAGTGKTLVAIEFMRELQRRDKLDKNEILCVCENQGIAQQIRNSALCNTVCRKTFIEPENTFSEVRHVVLEEVHRYREEPNSNCSCIGKARQIVRRRDPDHPGYLWGFFDMSQSHHRRPTGMPPEDRLQPLFTLTKVIRFSGKIFEYARKFQSSSERSQVLGHDFHGEDVVEIRFTKGSQSATSEVLNETLSHLCEGYPPGDIAVLFSKQDVIPDDLHQELNFSCCDAKNNQSNNIVVSTVDKYSGLERPVVVLFDLEYSMPYKCNRRAFLYSAVTRAMVKLLILRCPTGRSTASTRLATSKLANE